MAQFETWIERDLKKPNQVHHIQGYVFSQDHLGNRVGVTVTSDGIPATLSGTVAGYIIRADGATVNVTGACNENKAWIDLPQTAYAVVGQISIVIRLSNGGTKTTLAACTGYVYRTTTDVIVDPGHVIPSLDELLAQISAMETATANATAATGQATTAATSANTAAGKANTAASGADAAASRANTAAAAIENPTAAATTLSPGSKATANYADRLFSFGIPQGEKGDKGDKGDTGDIASITSQATEYQNSESGTAIPAGEWLSAPPVTPQGYFLWARTTITWNNGKNTVLYSVSRHGVDGSGAVSTVSLGDGTPIDPSATGNIVLPMDADPVENSANLVTSGGVRAAIALIDGDLGDLSTRVGTAETSVSSLNSRVGTVESGLAAKANTASPTFTGTPKAPTADTSANDTQIATTAFVRALTSTFRSGSDSAAWFPRSGSVAAGASFSCSMQYGIVCMIKGGNALISIVDYWGGHKDLSTYSNFALTCSGTGTKTVTIKNNSSSTASAFAIKF